MIELEIPSTTSNPIIRFINNGKIGKILQAISNCDENILIPTTTKAILINDEIKAYLNEYLLDMTKFINQSTIECIIDTLKKEELKIKTNITQKEISLVENTIKNNIQTIKIISESGTIEQTDAILITKILTQTNNLTLLKTLSLKNYTNLYINEEIITEAKLTIQKLNIDFIIY